MLIKDPDVQPISELNILKRLAAAETLLRLDDFPLIIAFLC
jgi:hypothetical protein